MFNRFWIWVLSVFGLYALAEAIEKDPLDCEPDWSSLDDLDLDHDHEEDLCVEDDDQWTSY